MDIVSQSEEAIPVNISLFKVSKKKKKKKKTLENGVNNVQLSLERRRLRLFL